MTKDKDHLRRSGSHERSTTSSHQHHSLEIDRLNNNNDLEEGQPLLGDPSLTTSSSSSLSTTITASTLTDTTLPNPSHNTANNNNNPNNPNNAAAAQMMTREKYGKLLFCFIGLQVSYVLWGITQENLMTTTYSFGKFTSSAFCVFGNRFLALLVAFIIVAYKNQNLNVFFNVPFYHFAPASLSNTLSSWAQYEALKYVSFPIQVLSKSCKVIPVMFVGILVNGKSYPLLEYIEAVAITIGVSMFTYSEGGSKKSPRGHVEADDDFWYYGITLLALYLFCDSFTSQWQSRLFKRFSMDQYQMMLGVNIWSMIFTLASLLYSNELISSIQLLLEDSTALWNMIILSITSATGQLFIFYTIKEFGPIIFTIFMTTRQLFSLFLSCLLFSHPLTWVSFMSAFFVFCVVFYRIYRKGSD